MMKTYDLAVIGGGASGLICAIEHKSDYPDSSVVIFEKLNRVGKKILATGNGRCNITNLTACPEDYNCPDFVSPTLERFSPQSNIDFFEKMGLITYCDSENRVYPHSNTASSVLDCLRFECERLKIDFLTDTAITDVKKSGSFIINNSISSKKVVLCTGGKSSSVHGSDGSGYDILRKLGHTIVKPSPSLVQICTDTTYTKQLKGLKVRGKITLKENNNTLGESHGEILFADYGISGIASLDLSMFIAREKKQKNLTVHIDMAESLSLAALTEYLNDTISRNPENKTENLLSCLLPSRIGQVVLKKCGIPLNIDCAALSKQEIFAVSTILKDFVLDVRGTKSFDMSQVTSGGADVSEFNKNTLESLKIKGLYCCGEILDVDSRCGGFNLQWAWSSGRLAGLCK